MSDRKVVLVTGAARGLGKALATGAANDGHDVVVNYRNGADEAEVFVAELSRLGIRAIALAGDVAVETDAARLVKATVAHFGRLDVLVNNAGVGDIVNLEEIDLATFEKTLRINLTGAFLMSQAAWPHMRERGGRLVFMSSSAAKSGGRISAAYAASKGGMEGLMHYYAAYLRPHRITANAIAPALIESAMVEKMSLPPADQLPLGRLGRADEIWPALKMIIDTEYLTGQTIHIDAGRYPT